MRKAILFFGLLFSVFSFAQNEFITVWKPSNLSTPTANNPAIPYQTNANQIWFPGRGTNFNVYWEEVGYPTHNGTMPNVTSTVNFLIDFGTPLNPNTSDATYEVKISNGSGSFDSVRFGATFVNLPSNSPTIIDYFGDKEKIIEISQWGNIEWQNMQYAYASCQNMVLSATDIPNLTEVANAELMFFMCQSLTGNSTINNWNVSSINNMYAMFGHTGNFNQPLDSWDTSNVTNLSWMFHGLTSFNQDISGWNTSNVTTLAHMFHFCSSFNQDISNWNTSKVTSTTLFLAGANNFNQNLDSWNLVSLLTADSMLTGTGLDCQNYDNTLYGWRMNPNTPSNINLGSVAPLVYSSQAAVDARSYLINAKGWTIIGDTYNGECESVVLGTTETQVSGDFSIYPNPVSDVLYIKTKEKIKSISVYDVSGKLVMKKEGNLHQLNVSHLPTGNYFLTVDFEHTSIAVKFIKTK